MWKSLVSISLALLGTVAHGADPIDGEDHKVRFQTHFHKPFHANGLGIGGWVVLPDVIGESTTTWFLIGPRIEGAGWWLEGLAGGIMTAGDPISHPWSLSGRFEVMPEAMAAPVRVWGNVQLNDLMGDGLQPYVVVMVDRALFDEQLFVGLESENRLNWRNSNPVGGGPAEQINDFSLGPHFMLPFGGLRITSSLQFHFDETVRDQYWLRVQYDFGPTDA